MNHRQIETSSLVNVAAGQEFHAKWLKDLNAHCRYQNMSVTPCLSEYTTFHMSCGKIDQNSNPNSPTKDQAYFNLNFSIG
jgi:hypothetical protein